MNIGEFAGRARAIRLSKEARYDGVLERLRRELKSGAETVIVASKRIMNKKPRLAAEASEVLPLSAYGLQQRIE